ncbi:MAG: hypothetical protein Kow0063_18270 [Anaerolineae bacterium]
MKKYGSILLSLLVLAAIAVGAYRAADTLQYSLFTYQSPLTATQVPPGEGTSPKTDRVVVVVMGGLGRIAARSVDMPNLEALYEAGASAPMISLPPTCPFPAWATLLTGAWPELNGAPILKDRTTGQHPIVFDHLFSAAHDAGLRTAIAGHTGWASLLPADTIDASVFTAQEDAIADAQVAKAALEFIANPQYNLIWVYLSQMDAVGRAEGTGSAAYASAALQVDNHLRQIIRSVDTSQSVLIVTSDHGLTEEGRLGGSEPELTELPFGMIGHNIIPGLYSPIQQTDLAPTIAALLGIRLPAIAQGRPLYEMMQLETEALTLGQLQSAAQKVALGDAYVRIMGQNGLVQPIHQDLDRAQQAMLSGNQAGALELAELINREVVAEMSSARAAHIARQRGPRLAIATIGLLSCLLFLWARRGPNTLLCIIGGSAAPVLFYSLYRLGGYDLSFNAIDSIDLFVPMVVRYAAIAMIGGELLLLVGLLYRDERRWPETLKAGYDYGFYAVLLAALPALFGFWKNGTAVRWYLPDLDLIVVQFVALICVSVVAVLAIPLSWMTALLVWGVGRWRTHAEARARAWDPMARLRRR